MIPKFIITGKNKLQSGNYNIYTMWPGLVQQTMQCETDEQF